jgi:hypothetical protein
MKEVPIGNISFVLLGINFPAVNMTPLHSNSYLRWRTIPKKLHYWKAFTPLFHFIMNTKQAAPIRSQTTIWSNRTTYHTFDKTQLTPFQCKHIARLPTVLMQGCHYTRHTTVVILFAGRRCENASSICSCEFGFHNCNTHKSVTATLL